MTEQEYDFIRTLENNNLNIMRRMSNIETLNNQNEYQSRYLAPSHPAA